MKQYMFSNKTKTGRSISVPWWEKAHYINAVDVLNANGVKATLSVRNVEFGFRGVSMGFGEDYHIHTVESPITK